MSGVPKQEWNEADRSQKLEILRELAHHSEIEHDFFRDLLADFLRGGTLDVEAWSEAAVMEALILARQENVTITFRNKRHEVTVVTYPEGVALEILAQSIVTGVW